MHAPRTTEDAPPEPSPGRVRRCRGRWLVAGFGWLNVGLGVAGMVVPGLPTTVFLLIAAWAFSKSSERFQTWLWTHPRLGPPVRAWHQHRAIPRGAKIAAVASMAVSLAVVTAFVAESWHLPAVLAAVMAPAALYIVTRAGVPAPVPAAGLRARTPPRRP